MAQVDFLKDKHILVVDDDERNLFALSSFLDSYDMRVSVAKDGQEALDLLEVDKTIDLILLDIMMPRLDGFDVLRILRESNDLKGIPVIAVTAKAMKGDRERCMEAGAWDYVPKPINLKDFMTKVKSILPPQYEDV